MMGDVTGRVQKCDRQYVTHSSAELASNAMEIIHGSSSVQAMPCSEHLETASCQQWIPQWFIEHVPN